MIFSVIIPVYNVEKYLPECVDSVLQQDFSDYEIILVNDGSTDGSRKICDEYAQKYSSIKVIHKENGGLSDARNFGVKEARGEYLMFLDSDDFWKGTDILLDLSKIIEKRHPDLIINEIASFFEEDSEMAVRKFQNADKIKSNIFKDNLDFLVRNDIYYATACNKTIKRSIVEDNDLLFCKGQIHEDVSWCADIIPYIGTFYLYVNPFYQYRKNRQDSLTYKITTKSATDLMNIIIDQLPKLSKIKGGLPYLSYNYYVCVDKYSYLKDEEYKRNFLKTMQPYRYLLKHYPTNGFKQKIACLIYRFLGIDKGSTIIKTIKSKY
ncbi:glycosyl transferase [Capnocytophaga stomatis]|uniref:glycosyltransferase family 2 protein n=1 Tax=Capnocytophaga stomatis TaxID=1848904 RepID=UPI00194DD989|nr:glycosyltransferase family 2 protein [Capnocytophaga stomatis]GIJ97802.1 glycosyl transferase [Capnocytophaga stomatis]GIM48736.1 glycosyl transferase [Capnocytophaga stomatis]